MRKPRYISVKRARSQLSTLLVEATKGHSTVITRYGKPVAAIVPVVQLAASSAQRSLLTVAGSGKGLWGSSSTRTVRQLRGEWDKLPDAIQVASALAINANALVTHDRDFSAVRGLQILA